MRNAVVAWTAVLGLLAGCGQPGFQPQPGDLLYHHDSTCATDYNRHFVYDFADLLLAVAGDLELDGCTVYEATGAHVVMVTVADTDGESLDTWAPKLMRSWGVGDKERHDGLAIVYALDDGTGGPAARIEVGYGLESVINTQVARRALDAMEQERATAQANGRDGHDDAMVAGALVVLQELLDHAEPHPPKPAGAGTFWTWSWWQIGLTVLVVLLVLSMLSTRGGRGISLFLLAALFGRRGGGGGGPGGFGGGKSGGGGFRGRL